MRGQELAGDVRSSAFSWWSWLFFAMLPFGLGLLLLLPVFSGAVYASYRDIFVASEHAAQTLPGQPPAGAGWRRIRHLPPQSAAWHAGRCLLVYRLLPQRAAGDRRAGRLADHSRALGRPDAGGAQSRTRPAGRLQTLYGGLKENTRTLVALGALYLAARWAYSACRRCSDGGNLLSFMLSGKRADRKRLKSGDFAAPPCSSRC
jgi:hypothetical protein